MREPENIRAVEEKAHPDMMGFIFWKGSKRYVSEPPAYLPECTRVGVFVNPTEDEVLQKVKDFGLNAIQLHGQETPDFCRTIKKRTSLPIIKAFSIGEGDASRFTLHDMKKSQISSSSTPNASVWEVAANSSTGTFCTATREKRPSCSPEE